MNTTLCKSISIILGTVLMMWSTSWAQHNGVSDTNNKVTVVAPYSPTISDAYKININPIISDSVTPVVISSYTTYPKMISTTFNVEPIKPAKLVDEKISKLYKSLVKAGFGTLTTPYGEIWYNNLRSKSLLFGAHFNHLSSIGQIKDYGNSSFSDNALNLWAGKYAKNMSITGGLNYSRDVLHYYGFKPGDFPNITFVKDDIKQRFSLISGDVKLQSTYSDSSKIAHSVGLKYYNLNDYFNTTENGVHLSGDISKGVQFIKNARKQLFELKADVDYFNYKFSTNSQNSHLVKLVPHYKVILDEYAFNVGVNTTVSGDSSSEVHLYPVADVSINLVKDILIVYSGLTGGVQMNSFKSLTDENPFVKSTVPMDFSYNKFDFFAGLKGNLSKNLAFNLSYNGSQVKNMALFVNDTLFLFQNKFTTIYDDVDVTDIRAEFAYQKTEKIKLLFRADYFQYTALHELKAWHKPEMDVMFSLFYNIENKIITKVDIFAFDKEYARVFDNGKLKEKKLNGIIDANLSVEWRYTKVLSAFVNFNNLGSSKYYRWNNYPSRRFNVLFGVSYAF
jgi:hypothetical protein